MKAKMSPCYTQGKKERSKRESMTGFHVCQSALDDRTRPLSSVRDPFGRERFVVFGRKMPTSGDVGKIGLAEFNFPLASMSGTISTTGN